MGALDVVKKETKGLAKSRLSKELSFDIWILFTNTRYKKMRGGDHIHIL